MEDLSKYSTEELERMLGEDTAVQPQRTEPATESSAPVPVVDDGIGDLSQYSTDELEAMLNGGEQQSIDDKLRQAWTDGDPSGITVHGDPVADAISEGVKGAGRAVKAIGGGFVGLGSGAVRLAGTPVRALTGWDGLHRVADSIDSGYEDWGSEALASDLPDDDWGRVLGGFGEKIAGTAGSLAALGGGGKIASAAGAALKAAGHAKTAAVAANALPLIFGNDAAVRTYDTAKENGSGTARALGLASVNGAIHYFGFKAFENQSLNKMLGMPQEMGAMMPGWANAARDGGAKTFTELASGVRNGMFKYILAERAKGALKAGGIMGLQNFLSSVPTQWAEGQDVDWGRAVSEGVGGVEEGALMEGLMGGAAMLKTPKAARKFIADTYFRNGYDLPNGQHVPGLLHSEEGRSFVMKQNPEMQRRILDILDHGGKVTKGELNAACLPPDMTEAELREFAKDWRKDLASEWDRAAEPEALGDGEELEGNEPVIPREQQMRNRAKVNEMRDHDQRVAEAEEANRARAEEQAADDAAVAAEEANWAEANAKADAERAAEQAGAEQLAREEAYPQLVSEQPAAPEQAPVQEPTEPPVAERSNRLRRNPKPNQQQPKEVTNETGNVPVEAQPEPPVQDAGRGGQQQAPQTAEGLVEGEAPRGEVPAAGEVAEARPAEAKPVAPAPAATQEQKSAEQNPVSKSDMGGQKLTGGEKEETTPQKAEATPPATQTEPLAAEPPKTASASAPRAEVTTTPPQSAEPVQGAESAAGGAAGGAAEEPKPTKGNKLRPAKKGKPKATSNAREETQSEIDEHNAKVAAEGDKVSAWSSDTDANDVKTGEPIIDKTNKKHRLLKKPLVVDVGDGYDEPDSDFASEDTKIKGRKVSPRVKAAFSELMEEAENDVGGEGLSQAKLIAFAKEHGFDGLVLQGLHDPNEHGWTFGHAKVISFDTDGAKKPATKLRTQAESEAAPKADLAPKADAAPAAPATQEATPEATTTPAPTAAEQPQPASQYRDENGNMKKTLRGAVERIASAIGNRTGKGAITPEEADAIVNVIAESPEAKHNRTRQFFTPLVTDAEWQNSLGVDAESAKNIRDAVVRAKTDSEMAHFFVQVDKAVKKAKAGKLSPKDAVPLNGKISEGLEKAEREGRHEAAKRLREALEVIKPVVDAVSQEDVDKFNRSAKGKKLHTQLDGSDRRRGSRGKTVSLDTKDGTVDVGADGRTLEDVADEISGSSHDRRTLKPGESYGKGFTKESDNDTTGTEGTRQGSTGKGGSLSGNRKFQIVERNGDDITVAMRVPKKGIIKQTVKLSQLRELAESDPDIKQALDSLEKGEEIRASKPAPESPASRDAKFAADADYQRWLKSRKANDAEPLRQRYEMEQAKALGDAFKNAVRGVDVEYVGDRDYDPAMDNPNGGRELKDRDTGTVLGIFDRDTGKLKLFRGANWKTLNHELGGHATMRLAEQLAAQGDRALLDKINEAVDGAMDTPLADEVRSRYPDADEATLRDEIWAALRERPSEAMQKYVKTLQGRKWYNRAWDAIKTAWRGILSRMGFNRADLSGIDKMTPDEFNEFLDKAMIGGKTLGRIETQGGEGIGNKLRKAFGGGLARVLPGNIGRYREAERMEADGANREDIWRKTGWWKGKDGKWRVELPDIKISNEKAEWLRNHARVYPDEPVSLESLIEAPELFRVYPSLKKIKVYASADRDIYGSQILDRIYLNRDLRVDKYRTVLAHEIQHVIQDFENFAKGGNLEDAKRLVEQRHPLLIKARDELVAIAKKSGYEDWAIGLSPEERRSISNQLFGMTSERIPLLASYINDGYRERPDYAKKMSEVNRMITKLREAYNAYKVAMADAEAKDQSRNITPTKIYNAFAGEVEARNVESRLEMSPEKRAATPPWATEDVPESEQIVRTGDEGAPESRGGAPQSPVSMARGPAVPTSTSPSILDDKVSKWTRVREHVDNSRIVVRKFLEKIGFRGKGNPVGIEEVMDPKTGFVDWRKSSDIEKTMQKVNGFEQKYSHILQTRRDQINKIEASMQGLDAKARKELINKYLIARHAGERNNTIALRNKETPNSAYAKGAGMSTDDANAFLASPEVQKYKSQLEEIAKIKGEVARDDLKLRHEYGLLSDEQYDFYANQWKDYVPLKTDTVSDSPEGLAFNISDSTLKRNEFRTAHGRGDGNMADNPLEFLFAQAADGIRKCSKNIVGNVTANAIGVADAKKMNEITITDPSNGSTKTEYRIAEIVPADVVKRGGTKFAATFSDGTTAEFGSDLALVSHQDNIVTYKKPEMVTHKDGTVHEESRLYAIRFNPGANGMGRLVAKGINGTNMIDVPFWVRPFSWTTHKLSRMNTSASVSFLTSNMFNDRNEAWRALASRFGFLDGSVMAGKMWKEMYSDKGEINQWLKEGKLTPGSDFSMFVNGGALIKGGNVAHGYSGELEMYRDNIAKYERQSMSLLDPKTYKHPVKLMRRFWDWAAGSVQTFNEAEEIRTRYGVYKVVKDALIAGGVDKNTAHGEAIKYSREATTDFNTRGALAPIIGSFYMFYNANVQGAKRNVQSLRDKHGVQTFTILASIAAAATALRIWANDDERRKAGGRNAENAMEHQKQAAMGLPVPFATDHELTLLKMRGIDSLIPYAATKFTEFALRDDVSAMNALGDSLRAAFGEAIGIIGGNGVGNKSQAFQTLAPTVIDPFIQFATGTDWKGDERVKRSFDKYAPKAYNGKHNTSEVFKWIAQTINDIPGLSGGNKFRSGRFDIAPEDVQLIVETVFGGLGRDFTGALNTGSNISEIAKGGSSDRLFSQMPIVKSLVREYPESTSRYYSAIDEYNADKSEFKKTTELGRRAELKKEHPYLTAQKGRVDALIEQVKELTHRERGEVKVGQKWVPMKTELPEARKEAFRKRRLRLQAEVLRILGK